ncbi:hypothetical protein CBR_g963 [Chara braunii]|uniref:Cytochrome b5 heme-binding domain-containing protein n=1 Tax=Chara braunii TaxID=69332 RepID=A0A388KCP8_CHABU|nr:hypothetical protein CBR_g963 [Chara braunii]|eukprot:GBG67842.1 hypothetical protein CBR_g963 [Chara braunii]
MAAVPGINDGENKKDSVISLEELRLHNSAESCWIAIHDKVYDITSWLSQHPGGKMVLMDVAGLDATDVFMAAHAKQVAGYLPRFYIGRLASNPLPDHLADFRHIRLKMEADGMFKTNYWFYIRLVSVLATFFSLAVCGVVFSKSTAVHAASAFLLGVVLNQFSFIGHDAGHNGISGKRLVDSAFGLLAGNTLTGIGIGWWKSTHNIHHIVCNSRDYDPDIQHMPVFAVSSKMFNNLYSHFHKRRMNFDSVARFLVSYQHFTYYPIMAVARVNLYLQTWIHIIKGEKNFLWVMEILGVAAFWTWYLSLLSFLPSSGEKAMFFLISHAAGGILHVQICVSHFPMPTFEGRPDDVSFVVNQLRGTLDIDCPTWLDWFHGGLQYQVIHHLFPRLPRHNLRKVRAIIEQFCKRHDLKYHSFTFLDANIALLKCLKKAALEARDYTKPAPELKQTMLWEALNAQG